MATFSSEKRRESILSLPFISLVLNSCLPGYWFSDKLLVEKAERVFTELIASSTTPVLVHGDLHHDNVLSSERAGWLAIDPKGIAAEPAYETAAMLRNPSIKLQNNPDIAKILSRRIMVMSEALQIEPQRIHHGDWHKRYFPRSGVLRMEEQDGNMQSEWQEF